MLPAEALGFIRGPTTKEFLNSTIISIASRTTGPAPFSIAPIPRAASDRHEIFRVTELVNQPAGQPFDAVSVPMRNRDALVAGIDGLRLPNAGNHDIMVTGMLTSCTFMYSIDKNNMFCAHIEPTRAPNPTRIDRGVELGIALTAASLPFTNDAGGVRYFSRVDYQGVHHVNILGVRRGDGWSLYVQAIATTPFQYIVFSKQLI
jgi:hypothetical protein